MDVRDALPPEMVALIEKHMDPLTRFLWCVACCHRGARLDTYRADVIAGDVAQWAPLALADWIASQRWLKYDTFTFAYAVVRYHRVDMLARIPSATLRKYRNALLNCALFQSDLDMTRNLIQHPRDVQVDQITLTQSCALLNWWISDVTNREFAVNNAGFMAYRLLAAHPRYDVRAILEWCFARNAVNMRNNVSALLKHARDNHNHQAAQWILQRLVTNADERRAKLVEYGYAVTNPCQ
jgi:hypothetical protein